MSTVYGISNTGSLGKPWQTSFSRMARCNFLTFPQEQAAKRRFKFLEKIDMNIPLGLER
jgi:hypothetical protein